MTMKSDTPDETWTEEELYQLPDRVACLAEINRRILSESLTDYRKAIDVLLDAAKRWGDTSTESLLVEDGLLSLIRKNDSFLNQVLDGFTVKDKKTHFLFFRVVTQLNKKQIKKSIPLLISFLMSGEGIADFEAKVVTFLS